MRGSQVARFLADVYSYTLHDSHAHLPAHALAGLDDDDLAYSPLPEIALDWGDEWRWPCVQTPRRILGHMVIAATQYANGLVGERGDEWSRKATEAKVSAVAESAEGLPALLDDTLQRLGDCLVSLTDAGLYDIARETWDGTLTKACVVIEGAVLHTAWHLGQLAMLIDWHGAEDEGHRLTDPTGAPGAFDRPRDRRWRDHNLRTRTEALRRLANAAYGDSPAHALRMVCEGISEHELAWKPFADIENPWYCRAMWVVVLHCWSPKIVYIDHGFGARELDYGKEGHIAGCGWGETDPQQQLAALDNAQQWLLDHVSEELLDRVNPMHVNVPMTGWQVVACMAQHDAWHAGQLSIMRDVYRALWERQSQ